MMQHCKGCEFFRPAHTCIEKPTWGHCVKLVQTARGGNMGKIQPQFTWADNGCDDFQVRPAQPVRR
jgi:hypothetical protein